MKDLFDPVIEKGANACSLFKLLFFAYTISLLSRQNGVDPFMSFAQGLFGRLHPYDSFL